MNDAKPKLIEFSAEASISMENGNIDRNIRDFFNKSFRCFRNSQTEVESPHSVSHFKGICFIASCISCL